MPNEPTRSFSDDSRLNLILAEFLKACEEGSSPDRKQLLRDYPEHADSLMAFFANHDHLRSTASDVRELPEVAPSGDAEGQTLPPSSTHGPSDDATIAPSPKSKPPAAGSKIRYFGEYELLEEIARGGMGVVYKARQTKLNRIVALKMILSGQLAGEEDVKRFHAEAEAAAQLDHPGIVPIFEVGEHEGQHYFSMSFVDGGSLADKIKDGPLPPRLAAEYVKKVAEAVAYAHEKGVIHRDLKPGNVLLDSKGEPKVTDFGLAKRVEDDSGLTATGQILGTPSYMPPEQASGKTSEISELADVYSVGAIFFALLTGRAPFQAHTHLDTLLQVLGNEPIAPTKINPNVPRDAETICLKCLEKSPARRYTSTKALIEDLTRYLNGEPISARPIGQFERTLKWIRRRPMAAAVVGLACFSVLAIIVSTFIFAVSQFKHARVVAGYAGRLEQERDRTAQALQESHRVNAITTLQRAIALCEKDEHARGVLLMVNALEMAEKARDTSLQEAIRWNIGSWSRQINALTGTLTAGSTPLCLAFNRDETRVAAGCVDGWVRVWEVKTGKLCFEFPHPTSVRAVAFHPQQLWLASGCEDGFVRIWNVESGQKVREIRHAIPESPHNWPGWTGVVGVAFVSDGRQLLCLDYPGRIRLWNVDTGEPSGDAIVQGEPGIISFAVHPDEQTVFTASHDWYLRRIDLRSGRQTRLGRLSGIGWGLAVEPEGRKLLVGLMQSQNAMEYQFSATQRLTPVSVFDHLQAVKDVAYTPDGRWALTASSDHTVRIWDVERKTQAAAPLQHPFPLTRVLLSRNGEVIATGCTDGKVRLWKRAEGYAVHQLPQGGEVWSSRFSPDGEVVATIGYRRTWVCNLWDVETGERILQPGDSLSSDEKGWGTQLAFAPDGESLFVACEGSHLVWQISRRSGQVLKFIGPHDNSLLRIQVSPSGKYLAMGGGFVEGKEEMQYASLWDIASGKKIGHSVEHPSAINAFVFSADSSELLLGSVDGYLQWYSCRNFEPIPGRSKTVDYRVNALAISPNGDHLAIGGSDRNAHLVDAETMETARNPLVHDAPVTSVKFASDGKLLLTSSEDGTGSVWALDSGLRIGPLFRHEGIVYDIQTNPAASLAVTGSHDGTARIWRMPQFDDRSISVLRSSFEASTSMRVDKYGAVRNAPIAAVNTDRRIAELVIQAGGTVTVSGVPEPITRITMLPKIRFRVVGIQLRMNPSMRGDLLPEFAQLTHLRELDVGGQAISMRGMSCLLQMKALKSLTLRDVQMTEEVTVLLGQLQWLSKLEVMTRAGSDLDRRLVQDLELALRRCEVVVRQTPAIQEQATGEEVSASRANEGVVELHSSRDLNKIIAHFCSRRQWKMAVDPVLQLVKTQPGERLNWLQAAAVIAMAEDEEAYQNLTTLMRTQFANADQLSEWEAIIKVCLLLPDRIPVEEIPTESFRQAIAEDLAPPTTRFAHLAALGLATWRAGDSNAAVEFAAQSLDAYPENSEPWMVAVRAMALLIHSMAQSRLGDSDKAEQVLNEAESLISSALEQITPDRLPPSWHDWLIAEVLRREAREVLIAD